MNNHEAIKLITSKYKKKGLYLIFSDTSILDLSKKNIENIAQIYWQDPTKLPEKIKKAKDFDRCGFCPLKGKNAFCDAIRPTFPFLDIIGKFISYDKVIAIYKDDADIIHISDTDMQQALKYLSVMSLTQFCRKGLEYWRYFRGVDLLSPSKDIAIAIYLNIYWLNKGNKTKIDQDIQIFNKVMGITVQNQIKRMNLVCKSDVFNNTFFSTHIISELMNFDIDKQINESFATFEQTRI
jgi:hypothetical protein